MLLAIKTQEYKACRQYLEEETILTYCEYDGNGIGVLIASNSSLLHCALMPGQGCFAVSSLITANSMRYCPFRIGLVGMAVAMENKDDVGS